MSTHKVIVADRSMAGIAKVEKMLRIAPFAAERINPWRNSTDRFIFFVIETAFDIFGATLHNRTIYDRAAKQLLATRRLPSWRSAVSLRNGEWNKVVSFDFKSHMSVQIGGEP